MASKEEVKDALREVLLEKTDFAASGPRTRLAAGWGKMSVRELIDYIFESTRVDGVTNLPDDLARKLAPVVAAISNVDEAVLAQFAAQPTAQAKADLLRAVLGSEADAVFRAGLNQAGTTA